MAFTYDKKRGQYRDGQGKLIKPSQIRSHVDQAIEKTKQRLAATTDRFIDGKIDQSKWESVVTKELKRMHTGLAQIGAGGKAQMDKAMIKRLNARLKSEDKFFKKMLREINKGKQAIDESLVARMSGWAESGKTTFGGIRHAAMIDAGFTEARNTLGATDNHCSECPGLSSDWIPIADMPPVGSRKCGGRDHCTIEYR